MTTATAAPPKGVMTAEDRPVTPAGLDTDRLWMLLFDYREHLGQLMHRAWAVDHPESVYWDIVRMAELARTLWVLEGMGVSRNLTSEQKEEAAERLRREDDERPW